MALCREHGWRKTYLQPLWTFLAETETLESETDAGLASVLFVRLFVAFLQCGDGGMTPAVRRKRQVDAESGVRGRRARRSREGVEVRVEELAPELM